MDCMFRAVVKARKCMEKGGSVGWALWDVKGGFQNVVGDQVLDLVEGCVEARCWVPWISQFVGERSFEVMWDGVVRGMGNTRKGVPQGSPLSPMLFLI